MASYNINSAARVFEHGGRIIFTEGSDTYTVLLVEEGTLEWAPGMWDTKTFTDRGALQDPLEGNERPTTLSFTVKFTSGTDSKELQVLLPSQKSSYDGKRRQFSVRVELPTYKGATTGEKITFAKCTVESLRITTGAQFDTMRIEMTDHEPKPTIAALP